MRKFITILLSVCMLMLFAGCNQSKTADVNEAIKKTVALDSVEYTSDYTIITDFFGEDIVVENRYEVKAVHIHDDNVMYRGKLLMSVLGTDISFDMFSNKDRLYVSSSDGTGEKIYLDANSDEANAYLLSYVPDNFMKELPEAVVKAATVTKNSDGTTTFQFALTPEQAAETFKDYIADQSYNGLYEVTVEDFVGDIIVNADGYVVRYAFRCKITNSSEEMDFTTSSDCLVEINYIEPGKDVTVEEIDYSEYVDYNNLSDDEYEDDYDYEVED